MYLSRSTVAALAAAIDRAASTASRHSIGGFADEIRKKPALS